MASKPLNKPLFLGGGSFDGGIYEGHDIWIKKKEREQLIGFEE